MKARLFVWSITAALAGFLFGFDTVVISGAEQTIQALRELSPAVHGLAMSMALWGTVVGSLAGSWPTDHFGRKKTLLYIGHRAQGQSLGSFTHWIFAALLTLFFPSMVEKFHPGSVFGFFCFMMVLQLIWVKLMVPETKGRPLEDIEHDLGTL